MKPARPGKHVEEVVAENRPERLCRRNLRARDRRNAHPDDGSHPVGMQLRRTPHHRGTPVVADQHRRLGADVVEQADQVAGQVDDVVVADAFRAGAASVTALIGCQHVVTGSGQRRDLATPGIAEPWEAVCQHHDRCAGPACFEGVQPHAVGVDGPFGDGLTVRHRFTKAHAGPGSEGVGNFGSLLIPRRSTARPPKAGRSSTCGRTHAHHGAVTWTIPAACIGRTWPTTADD